MKRDLKDHLTEEEFLHFVMEDLDEEEQAAVDAHVENCVGCAKELEQYYEADASFPEAEWAARRPALVASLRLDAYLWQLSEGLSKVWERFKTFVAPLPERVTVTSQQALVDDHAPDGALGLYAAVDDTTGTLTLRLESRAMEHEGWAVVVGDERWSRVEKLTRVSPTVLGAEIKVRADERATIPAETGLRIRVEPETGAPTGGSGSARDAH